MLIKANDHNHSFKLTVPVTSEIIAKADVVRSDIDIAEEQRANSTSKEKPPGNRLMSIPCVQMIKNSTSGIIRIIK